MGADINKAINNILAYNSNKATSKDVNRQYADDNFNAKAIFADFIRNDKAFDVAFSAPIKPLLFDKKSNDFNFKEQLNSDTKYIDKYDSNKKNYYDIYKETNNNDIEDDDDDFILNDYHDKIKQPIHNKISSVNNPAVNNYDKIYNKTQTTQQSQPKQQQEILQQNKPAGNITENNISESMPQKQENISPVATATAVEKASLATTAGKTSLAATATITGKASLVATATTAGKASIVATATTVGKASIAATATTAGKASIAVTAITVEKASLTEATPIIRTATTAATSLTTATATDIKIKSAASKNGANINIVSSAKNNNLSQLNIEKTVEINDQSKIKPTIVSQNNIKANISDATNDISSKPANILTANIAVAAQSSEKPVEINEAKFAASLNKETIKSGGEGNNAFTKDQNKDGSENSTQSGGKSSNGKNNQSINAGNINLTQNTNFNKMLHANKISANAQILTAMPKENMPMASFDPMSSALGSMTPNTAVPTSASAVNMPSKPNIPPHIISQQVTVNIQRAIGANNDRINIQLRPQELGRIDIAMEMGKDGRLSAIITVERPETLEMLKSDVKNLIQSLNNAGIETEQNNLSFNLKNNNENGAEFAKDFTDNNKGKNQDEQEFNLDDSQLPNDKLLAEGENAKLDQDGHLNVKV